MEIPESTLRSFSFACEEVVLQLPWSKIEGSLRGESAVRLRGLGDLRVGSSCWGAFFLLFLFVSFCCCFGCFLDAFKAIFEFNMTPTWVLFGAMLGHFSDMFGCSSGSLI